MVIPPLTVAVYSRDDFTLTYSPQTGDFPLFKKSARAMAQADFFKMLGWDMT